MTNDLTTLNGCMQEAIDRLENNLAEKGIDATYSSTNGFFDLIDKIQNIHLGITFNTYINISADKYTIQPNEAVTLNGTLNVVYNDTINMNGLLKGATVKIYDGETLIDTVTTNNNGEFTSTFTLSDYGESNIKAIFEGVTDVFEDYESSTVVIYCSNTNIELNVPLSLVYSDSFNITGTLIDLNEDGIAEQTVSLIVGNTIVDTDTTDSNGEFSFTQTPVSMGTHSFQVVFDGDITYYASGSSVITREIGKETSVLNTSSPLNNSSIYSDGNLTVSGVLISDDAEVISGANILVQQNGNTLTTLTSSNDGSFSGNVSGSNLITGNIDIIYNGNGNYTNCSSNISIIVHNPSLSLTSDKNKICYSTEDVAILTATLICANPTGKTVQLYEQVGPTQDPSNDTLLGTMTDGLNGTYTYTLNSTGTEDRYLYAKIENILSQSYHIYDNLLPEGLLLKVMGSSITSNSNIIFNTNGSIDWGDGIIENASGEVQLTHTYSDGLDEHNIICKEVTGTKYGSFMNRSYLKEVFIPNTITLAGSEFGQCSNLTDVIFEDGITSLSNSMFNWCTSLKNITLPNTLTSIPTNTFTYCSGLENINLPESITSIGYEGFRECNSLEEIILPEGVTTLGPYCFQNCSSLNSITIPSTVTSIQDNLFYGCNTNLVMYLNWKTNPVTYKPCWFDRAWRNCVDNTNTTFSIPYGTTQAYINAGYPSARLVERPE